MKSMIHLVGGNPLPIFLTHRQLGKDAAPILVCSKDTEPDALAIEKALDLKSTIELLEDPWDPQYLRARLASICEQHRDAPLNYTGGTKVMSAMGLWSVVAKGSKHAIYLEDKKGQFHIMRGADFSTEPLNVFATLEEHFALHQIKRINTPGDRPTATLTELLSFPESRLPIVDFLRYLKGSKAQKRQQELNWFQDNYDTWKADVKENLPMSAAHWFAAAGPVPVGLRDYSKAGKHFPTESVLCQQLRYFEGLWFEDLVRQLIEQSDLFDEVLWGVMGQPLRTDADVFEVDILARRHSRTFLFSVTTDKNESTVKQKAFEARERSRQLFGDLSRMAVVSNAKLDVATKVKATLKLPPVHIFGSNDLAAWKNEEKRDRFDSLRDFVR